MGRRSKICWPWLLFGLSIPLQLISSLSLAEAFILFVGPFWMMQDWGRLQRDGLMPIIALSFLMIIGCAVGSIVNHTHGAAILRGMATTCIVFFSIAVIHRLFVRHMGGFPWYFVGTAIASVVCVFIFKRASEAGVIAEAGVGKATAEEIMAGPIFLICRLGAFVNVPINGWYLQTPLAYSILAPFFMAIFSALTSTSGRSASLLAMSAATIIYFGGKSRRTMSRISKYFFVVIITGFVFANLAYLLYVHAAENKWLSEEAIKKYERQTSGGGGIIRLLISGRTSSFTGIPAILDKPIVGHGPWALDYNGYAEQFLSKYGSPEDCEEYAMNLAIMRMNGAGFNMIGCHSTIVELWVWYGIAGFLFCAYVLFVYLRYLTRDVAVVPQWFGYLAAQMPTMLWGYFFSPFASRINFMMFLLTCLIVRAVKRGAIQLPLSMQEQIWKVENRR